jgi:hypothetical protein
VTVREVRYASEHGLEDRPHPAARQHGYGHGRAAGATERQAGRERYRFTPSPLDRFMEPNPPAKPLLRWDCDERHSWRGKARSRRNRNC